MVVPDGGDLRAQFLDEIYRQSSTAHPRQGETDRMVAARCYWLGLAKDVQRYVDDGQACKKTKTWRDRAPWLLQLLPVPAVLSSISRWNLSPF